MDIAVSLLQIWRRKIWLIPIVVVALIAFLAVAFRVSLNPPGLESRALSYGFAKTSLLVDSEKSSLAHVNLPVAALGERASVYAGLLGSDVVLREIGEEAGVRWQSISVDVAKGSPGGTPGPERGNELASDSASRHIFASVVTPPFIEISTQASTAPQAIALAEAAATALPNYLEGLQQAQGIEGPSRVALSEVGSASGGLVGGSNNLAAGIVAAILVTGLGMFLILFVPKVWHGVKEADEDDRLRAAGYEDGHDPSGPSLYPGNGYSEAGLPGEPAELESARRGKTTASSE